MNFVTGGIPPESFADYFKTILTEPTNYRGVTLMSSLGKLFTSVLNNRLLLFSTHNKILSDSQLAFLAGNRTSDACIILNNIIR